MTDQENEPITAEPVAELKRAIEEIREHDRKGLDIEPLLQRAQRLVDRLDDNPSVGVVAGYQMKRDSRVFYPADFKPADTKNFLTLVYAKGSDYELARPHFVLRYVDHVGGPLGKTHALVSVADWNAGMSGGVAEQVCDAQGQPLVVYPRPMLPGAAEDADKDTQPCN